MLGLEEKNLLAIVLHTRGAPLEILSGTGVTTSPFSLVLILFRNRNTGVTHKRYHLQDFNLLGGISFLFFRKSKTEFGSSKVSPSCPFRAAFFATKADLKARKWMQSFSRCYQANLQLNF